MGSKAHRGSESAKVVVLQRLWRLKEGAPMPTECSSEYFDFGTVEGRAVEAAFDGGLVRSDAGALLLGATDRAIGLIDRFAACFHDERREDLIEHEVVTLVGQRVFGIALGYEDLNDHDQLRHDPMMAVLAGKACSATAGLRSGCRQVDAQPAGAISVGTDALSQDQSQCSGDQESSRAKPLSARTT